MLGIGLHGLANGPHLLGIMSKFWIMSHSGLCLTVSCCSRLCRIRGYVVWHNVALCRIGLLSFGIVFFSVMLFGVMSFGVLSLSLLSV